MRHGKRFICILLSALMLVSALSGCAREAEEPEEGERFTLRAAVCSDVDLLDPAMNTDPRAESIYHALYENLMRMSVDEDGNTAVVPGMAKEYRETTNFDGSVDYVFTLRSTARWSDGTRVKAKDFVFAWRRLVAPENVSPNRDLLSMVKGYDAVQETGDTMKLAVKAEGDTTFRVTLSAPCPYFLGEVCTAVPTMPLPSDAIGKDPDWASGTAVPQNGPFQTSLWVKGAYIQLRRNDSYYESRLVGPDVLRFTFAADNDAAWRMYQNGEVDYMLSPPLGVEPTGRLPLRGTACVYYNHAGEAFSNPHVRRAFDLVLDRGAIAAAVGAAMTGATGLVPSGVVNAAAGEEADFRAVGGELIAVDEAGYATRCHDGEIELRSGGFWGGVGFPPVSCLYLAGDEESRAVASVVVAQWQEKLNIDVTTVGVTREEFTRRVLDGDYDLAIDTEDVSGGDAMEFLSPFAGTDGSNVLHYVSKPYDLLIGVAGSSTDPNARAAFLHDAEALLLSDTALSPLYFRGTAYMLRDGLTGVWHDLNGNVYFAAASRTDTVNADE